jgi:hypothetical protein
LRKNTKEKMAKKWGLRKNPTARNPATMQPVAQFMGLWIFMQLVA